MAVEIYSEPELQEMVSSKNNEELETWKELVATLDMEGQQSLVSGDKQSPSPYMYMTDHTVCIFGILCPVAVDYKKYNKTTIPVAVLKEIAYCNEMQMFDSIKIWYDDVEKDPVVVGYIRNPNNSPTLHLIARFGDEVLPFEILREKALKRLMEKVESVYTNLENLKQRAKDCFNRGSDSFYLDSVTIVPWGHKRIE